MENKSEFETAVHGLLEKLSLGGLSKMEPIEGGANNQSYRVETAEGAFFLKRYFRHPADMRDRLGAEFSFLRFAWDNGVRCVPRPIGSDAPNALGLYEFIAAETVRPGLVSRDNVRAAAVFFKDLNQARSSKAAQSLKPASEACFSIEEHVLCVQKRVGRLGEIAGEGAAFKEARAWVETQLAPFWKQVKAHVDKAAAQAGFSKTQQLPGGKCISPSDFGFHNALVRDYGELCFIDFEYSGWDHVSKVVCDFFFQPKVPVPWSYFDMFNDECAALFDPQKTGKIIRLLLPLYGVKWCCIILNDFLPVGAERRGFAIPGGDLEERLSRQLKLAGETLKKAQQAIHL